MAKLCKNENDTLYQIYLPKLNENILKYSRLNLLKEIAIGFYHNSQMTLEFSASFFNSFLA